MKTAIVDGVEVEAWSGAPQKGRCPACGGQVALWNHPRGGCYYRHVAGEGKECPRRTRPARCDQVRVPPKLVRDDPELTLAVKITNTASVDALSGDAEALEWLLKHPLPRTTLEALHIDPDVALARVAAQASLINRPTTVKALTPYSGTHQTPGRLGA